MSEIKYNREVEEAFNRGILVGDLLSCISKGEKDEKEMYVSYETELKETTIECGELIGFKII